MLRDPFEHAALVQRIQSECFAEDIEPPADSLGWTEEELHAFFESGGDELPLRFAETPGVPVRIIPAGMRARVFVISDMHCDHPQNFGWIQQRLPASSSGCFDVCVCCGDVSDNLGVLRQALGVLRARFDEVFFTPGNHELWVRKEPPGTTSLDRIETVRRLCQEKRVR
ncbi:hypothetical protein EMIHUDRAFT_257624, partial [Emiliania huxleyi CCMP1516]|uniref:Calcineurin-like phosphoesterase domain-containing protein n=2 Tax=Emiliania huxleyi TaxID=2903 RepID=A0A0D3IHP3_EMIH1